MTARIVVSRDGVIEREVRIEREATVVGRHPACDIVLDDPAVSLRHLLLRVVDRTLCAEDLESTNGLRVNDVAVDRRVLRHLDVIQVGLHKLHVFDEAMLPGSVASLDHTVQGESERTMYLRDSDRDAPLAAPARPAQHERAAPRRLGLQPLDSERLADTVRLELANTLIGEADESALVVRRRDEVFLTKVSRSQPLRINSCEMGAGSHRIAVDDVIEVGSLRYRLVPLEA